MGDQRTARNTALVAVLTLALAGCAAIDVSHQYETAHSKPIKVTTVVEGSSKSWNVYAHPTDLTRILVTESTTAGYAKALNPIGAFANLTAASSAFDEAVEAYLRVTKRSCEIARSNEIPDMFAYEYRLRCPGSAEATGGTRASN